jgi:hypothetical protein
MTKSRYAMPLDDFVARTRVAAADQAEVQALPGATTGPDWCVGHPPAVDGAPGCDGD